MNLSDEKIGFVVKMLAEKPLYQTGLAFEFDKYYKSSTAVANAVNRLWQKARKDPEKYGLNNDHIAKVEEAVAKRKLIKRPNDVLKGELSLREKNDLEAERKADIKELVLDGRKKAFDLLLRKLDRIGRNHKSLDEANLSTIAQTFGIIFDKAQIIQGEATENVAVMSKISVDMKPEEALEAVLKMREQNQVDKERKKK